MTAQQVASGATPYTAEALIFDEADAQMTYEQVLTTLYESEDEEAW